MQRRIRGAGSALLLCLALGACGSPEASENRETGGSAGDERGGAAAVAGSGESAGEGGTHAGTSAGGRATTGGSEAAGEAGTSALPSSDVHCPSLGLGPDSALFVAHREEETELIRADGSVLFRHAHSILSPATTLLRARDAWVLAATESRLPLDASERGWEVARFDSEGTRLRSASGAFPLSARIEDRIYAPNVRLEGDSVAFELESGDIWLVDAAGNAELHACARHDAIGETEEPGWIAAWIRYRHGTTQAAFLEPESGECRRLENIRASAGTTLFQQGRFQYLRSDSVDPVLSDEGPFSAVSFALPGGGANGSLHSVSEDALYVLAAPELGRYDAIRQTLDRIELPAAATELDVHGERVVGFRDDWPLWSFDLIEERAMAYDLAPPEGSLSRRSSDDFVLLWVDALPSIWLDLATGESWPFEIDLGGAGALEVFDSDGPAFVLVADGLPVAYVDVAAGGAAPIELPRGGDEPRTFRVADGVFVVLDGAPAFKVAFADGAWTEVQGAADLGSAVTTEQLGAHIVVASDGRPSGLLDVDSAEILSIAGADDAPGAAIWSVNERYIVGFDERGWPVFRVDAAERSLETYRLEQPADLLHVRHPTYVEAPGDALYEENYAKELDAEVLADGSVALALRDERQARLWLATPEDTEFRPFGRPFTDVIGLEWRADEHSFHVSGAGGNCFCVEPTLRWEDGADADVLSRGPVELISRAHPDLVVVYPDHLVYRDPSGVCVVEPGSAPLVHDLLAGTTRPLPAATDALVTFVAD